MGIERFGPERRITPADHVSWVGPMGAAEAILMNMTMDGRLPVGRCARCRQLHNMDSGRVLVLPHPVDDQIGAAECPGGGHPPGPLDPDEED